MATGKAKVHILDYLGRGSWEVVIPTNIQAQEIIQSLIRDLDFPNVGSDGVLDYDLMTETADGASIPLHPRMTLNEAGIGDGITLRLVPIFEDASESAPTSTSFPEASLRSGSGHIRLLVEDAARERFEAIVPKDEILSQIASDFLEERGWSDFRERKLQASIELVVPNESGRAKRLDGTQSVAEAGLQDGSTVRIVPEMVEGCFPRDVMVTLANGSSRPICDVAVGDELLSGIPSQGRLERARVASVYRGRSDEFVILNGLLSVTSSLSESRHFATGKIVIYWSYDQKIQNC